MVGCVFSQIKPSGFSTLSCEKGLGLRPQAFFTAKNGEVLRRYPIWKSCIDAAAWGLTVEISASS